MNLTELLNTDLISLEKFANDKQGVLSAVADLAAKHPALKKVDKETLLNAIAAREELGTTGFGKGIAIPHCRIEEIDEFVLGVIVLQESIDFDSLDGEPVNLIVFLIAPEEQSNKHIRLLSSISQVLRIPGAIQEITSQRSPGLIRESFLKFVDDEVDSCSHESKNLFQVAVTNEDIFHDILPLFSALDCSFEYILEAKKSSDYMNKVPLFAGLLNDEFLSFCRIIVATVEKRMTNELIRRIESITGPLDSSQDAMVIVQDVVYASCSSKS